MIETVEAGPLTRPDLNRVIGDFVSTVIWGEPGRIEKYSSLGVFKDSRLIAGVLYHNWQPQEGVIELSAGSQSKRWLTRPVLKAMFGLPFDRWGCQLAVLRVSERNRPMIRIAKAYGFDDYRIPRLRGRDEAEHIMTLTDDAWRSNGFHKEHRHGQG